jgi:hypothetical protein
VLLLSCPAGKVKHVVDGIGVVPGSTPVDRLLRMALTAPSAAPVAEYVDVPSSRTMVADFNVVVPNCSTTPMRAPKSSMNTRASSIAEPLSSRARRRPGRLMRCAAEPSRRTHPPRR